MITRSVYREDHEMFRASVRRFVEKMGSDHVLVYHAVGATR